MSRNESSLSGILVGCLIAVVVAAALFPMVNEELQKRGYRTPACVKNLKQLGLVLCLYANENKDRFPPIDDTKNNFMFEGDVLYPEYLTDVSILACPRDSDYDPDTTFRLVANASDDGTLAGEVHPDCLTDLSYVYLGWMVMSDKKAEAFFEAYDTLPPEDFDKNITVAEGKGNAGGSVLNRLSSGVDRFLITDINMIFCGGEIGASVVPIIWEKPYLDPKKSNHQPAGGYVIYLDGHVEYIEMGDAFPMTETMARLLEEHPRAPIPGCEMSVAALPHGIEN